jgi:hypothetical protein
MTTKSWLCSAAAMASVKSANSTASLSSRLPARHGPSDSLAGNTMRHSNAFEARSECMQGARRPRPETLRRPEASPDFAQKSRERRPHHFWLMRFSRVCPKVSARIATQASTSSIPRRRLEQIKGRRGKNVRMAAAPRTYRRVSNGSKVWRRKNRVLPIAVDPRGTSRTCPAYGEDDRRHRKRKVFSIEGVFDRRCFRSKVFSIEGVFRSPAITRAMLISAALENILIKTLAARGRVRSPGQKMSTIQQDVADRQ